jgi:O-antigen ligase
MMWASRLPRVKDPLLGAFTAGLAVSISLSQTALVLLALCLLVPSRERPPLRWPLVVPLTLFALVTTASALASAHPLESLIKSRDVLLLGTTWVVMAALTDGRAASRFVRALFLALSAVAIVAIAQVALCGTGADELPVIGRFLGRCARARGFFSIYMTLGGVLMAGLVAVLPRLVDAGVRAAWSWMAWLLSAAALALTYVRGAWIGFVVGVAGSLLVSRRRVVVLLALGAVIGLIVVAVPGVWSRARSIGNTTDATAADRLAMAEAGLRMARERPILGLGPGQVKRVYPEYAAPTALLRQSGHLHNTPLQILVERGALGLLAWMLIYAEFLVRAGRIAARLPRDATERRALVLGSMFAVVAFLVAGLFEYNFGDSEVLMVVSSLMAVPFVIDRLAAPAGRPA